jgi:hypothetical protein
MGNRNESLKKVGIRHNRAILTVAAGFSSFAIACGGGASPDVSVTTAPDTPAPREQVQKGDCTPVSPSQYKCPDLTVNISRKGDGFQVDIERRTSAQKTSLEIRHSAFSDPERFNPGTTPFQVNQQLQPDSHCTQELWVEETIIDTTPPQVQNVTEVCAILPAGTKS